MSASDRTRHAVLRMSQRGIRMDDLEVIELFGTDVEGGPILLQKDAQAAEREAKKFVAQIWRLVGTRVVRDGDTIVTAYRACRVKERRLLRGSRRRG